MNVVRAKATLTAATDHQPIHRKRLNRANDTIVLATPTSPTLMNCPNASLVMKLAR